MIDQLHAEDLEETGRGGRDEASPYCTCATCGHLHETVLHDPDRIDGPTYGVFDTSDDLIAGPYLAVQDALAAYRHLLAYGHHARHLTVGEIR